MGKRKLVQITGWFPPPMGRALKDRMKRIKRRNHRMTESRLVEDALLAYLPILEERLLNGMRKPPTNINPS